jgi:hypothetical protein
MAVATNHSCTMLILEDSNRIIDTVLKSHSDKFQQREN